MSTPPHAADSPPPEAAAAEPQARPKFSRRPASFSRPAPTELLPSDAIGTEPSLPPFRPVHAAPAAWQEDARFGIVMLLILLLVNVLLVYGLAHLPDRPRGTDIADVTPKASSMPQEMAGDHGSVTLYSQPEAEQQTIDQLDLRSHDGGPLSVSPQDIPAPTARALDKDDE